MSGDKQTEIGVIPADWNVTQLDTLTDPKRPICYGIVQTGPSVLNGVRCLRVIDISNGQINKTDLITTTKSISDSYKRTILRTGDLVMPLRGKVGDIAIVDEDLAGSNLTRGVALIAIQSEWSSRYCQQFISSTSTRKRLEQAMNGSALQEIPIVTLRAFKIALPPTKAEQEAIAEALSDADALIESLTRLIAKKRQIKQGAMQELLTGKRRLHGFANATSGYKQTEVGVIPEDWKLRALGEIVTFLDGKRRPVKDVDRAKMQGTIPYYGASGIVDYVNAYLFDEELILLGEDGENILSRNCRLAFRISGKAWVNNHAHVLRPNQDVNIGFLTDYLESLNYERFNSGTAQPKLNKQTCSGILVALPPTKAEQEAIAEVLSEMDAEITALETKLAKARQLKQGMMHNLLTGRIRLV